MALAMTIGAVAAFAVISPSLLGWATMLALPMGILAGVVLLSSRRAV